MIGPEKWNKLLDVIAGGQSNKRACALVGISETAFYDKKSNDSDFSDRVKAAEAKFIQFQLDKINNADQWQSAAWMLERKFPEEFKERKETAHKLPDTESVREKLFGILKEKE